MFRNKWIAICLLVAGACLVCAQSASQPMIPIDDRKILAIPVDEATTEPPIPMPTTTTTTPAPTTQAKTTTTTTLAPTTQAKTTTTTTTPAPTTSTTPAPDTTTVAPTPAPTPGPPEIGKWNSSCIMLQMAAQLNFTYVTADDKNATAIYNIPSNATVHDSTCESNTTQQIVLNWGPDAAIHSLTLNFEHNNKSNVNVHMILFNLPIDASEFPNAKPNQVVQLLYRGDVFEAPFHMSYHCTRAQKFNLTETIPDDLTVGFLRLSDVQVEAFRDKSSTQFSTARDCDSSETPDIVPIAVGIALAALILIVLISYLCARRRSTARGYMSF